MEGTPLACPNSVLTLFETATRAAVTDCCSPSPDRCRAAHREKRAVDLVVTTAFGRRPQYSLAADASERRAAARRATRNPLTGWVVVPGREERQTVERSGPSSRYSPAGSESSASDSAASFQSEQQDEHAALNRNVHRDGSLRTGTRGARAVARSTSSRSPRRGTRRCCRSRCPTRRSRRTGRGPRR